MILHQQGLQQVTTASHPLEGGSTVLGSGLQAGERGSSAKESFKLPSPARPTAEAVVRKTPLGPKCRGVKTLTASGKKYRF